MCLQTDMPTDRWTDKQATVQQPQNITSTYCSDKNRSHLHVQWEKQHILQHKNWPTTKYFENEKHNNSTLCIVWMNAVYLIHIDTWALFLAVLLLPPELSDRTPKTCLFVSVEQSKHCFKYYYCQYETPVNGFLLFLVWEICVPTTLRNWL